MPDIVMHNQVGRSVYKRLPPEIVSDIDREIYRLGLIGPDPYAAYRFFAFPFRKGIHRRITLMHTTRTADFLVELAKYSRTGEMFSYLAGFLCHFALDSTAHPYINAVSNYKGYMHLAVEHRLDVQQIEKMGMKLSDRPITSRLFVPFLPESMRSDYETVMKNIYGWDDSWTRFKAAYRHFRLLYSIKEDPYGIVDMTLKHVPYRIGHGKVAVLSYRSHVCDGRQFEEFEELRRKAVKRAIEMIEAAYQFRCGEIGEEELRRVIGEKDYRGK